MAAPDISIGGKLSMTLDFELKDDHGNLVMELRMIAPDVEVPGAISRITFAHCLYGFQSMPKECVQEFVYKFLRNAMVHELDEQFRVNGERVLDPHKKTGVASDR